MLRFSLKSFRDFLNNNNILYYYAITESVHIFKLNIGNDDYAERVRRYIGTKIGLNCNDIVLMFFSDVLM